MRLYGRAKRFNNVYEAASTQQKEEMRKYVERFATYFRTNLVPAIKAVDLALKEKHHLSIDEDVFTVWGRGNPFGHLSEEKITVDEAELFFLPDLSKEDESETVANTTVVSFKKLGNITERAFNSPSSLFADALHNYYIVNEATRNSKILGDLYQQQKIRALSKDEKSTMKLFLAFGAAIFSGLALDRNTDSLSAIQVAIEWTDKDEDFQEKGNIFYQTVYDTCSVDIDHFHADLESLDILTKNVFAAKGRKNRQNRRKSTA